MKFRLEEIGRIAGNFLDALQREGIITLDDMKARVGTSFYVNDKDSIKFDRKVHTPGLAGISYIANYERRFAGLPIEFRVNDIAGFALVILRATRMIKGY